MFSQYDIQAQDRALATEIAYGTMRNRKILDAAISKYLRSTKSALPPYHLNVLRISLYQHLYLDKIPAYAIVNEAVKLVFNKKDKGFINAVLRRMLAGEKKDVDRYSIKGWLGRQLVADYGRPTAIEIVKSFSKRPQFSIRVNRLKTNRETVARAFGQSMIAFEPGRWLEEYLTVRSLSRLRNHAALTSGAISIQDEAEGLVVELLDPAPGELIIDLCAGPGGKTGHIAELVSDQGLIVAVDADPAQLAMIADNQVRLGLNSVRPMLADGRRLADFAADRILVDAPCSNLGSIRKRPEVSDWLKPKDIDRLAALQGQLLESAARNLKPGGVLVYSTCTILAQENEKVIERFLGDHDFEIEPAQAFLPKELGQKFLKVLPHQFETDGVFAARLRKIG